MGVEAARSSANPRGVASTAATLAVLTTASTASTAFVRLALSKKIAGQGRDACCEKTRC